LKLFKDIIIRDLEQGILKVYLKLLRMNRPEEVISRTIKLIVNKIIISYNYMEYLCIVFEPKNE
jgi:hypothetical protein